MYTPSFNSVLVEIDDADAKWGTGNDDSMMGASYSKGTVVQFGDLVATNDYPVLDVDMAEDLVKLKGKSITWNEGTEAGTTWDEDGKKYGFIYWYDIRGVKE